jgi:hypothetical protein
MKMQLEADDYNFARRHNENLFREELSARAKLYQDSVALE